MKAAVDELNNVVDTFSARISRIPDSEFDAKPLPNKWSRKEVLGHLIDSGHNNLRRFVCGQYESVPPKITYDKDFWVAVNNYQEMEKNEVIALWKLINQRIAAVLLNMPEQNRSRQCDTGKVTQDLHSLQWLADDYIKHMKHHLNQIIPASFDVIYR